MGKKIATNDFKEPLCNIRVLHKDCAPEPGKYVGKKPEEFLNKFVKLKFPSPQGPEYMWVIVNAIGTQGTDLEGTLDNDPIYDVGFECGDYIGFDISEIVDIE